MCWLTSHEITVPSSRSTDSASRHQRANRVMFQIRVSSTDAASESSITVGRPLAAFHALRSDLLRLTQPSAPSPPRGPRWMRRVVQKSAPLSRCTCESPCPFASLHRAISASLPALPSPGALTFRPFAPNVRINIDEYRSALETWLRGLHGLFTSNFSAALLQTKYQRQNCAVMNAYAAFLDAQDHFRVVGTSTIRRPLMLRAWRAEQDQAALDDISLLEADEDDDLLEDDEVLGRAKPVKTETITEKETPPTPTSTDAVAQLLPRLDVKRVGLATLQTFLEDFCDTILAQHGQDIAELQSPELTQARRWEIGLYVACRLGHCYGAQLILFYYADANVALADGTTCLHIAARMGRTSIVALLLQEGAEVDKANHAGITPLIAACRNGCVDVAKMLLDTGADVRAQSERGTQPLHAAIVSQSQEMVQLLLDNGANVRATTSSGLTPLHFAARVGSVELSELLLRNHADPEQQTKSGSDALMIATTNGHLEICELFQKEMDRKNFLSASGGKLFHRFKKTAQQTAAMRATEAARFSDMRRRGESQEDANSVIRMNENTPYVPLTRRTLYM